MMYVQIYLVLDFAVLRYSYPLYFDIKFIKNYT